MEALAAVVLDIEGTTTPISFVHDHLFPYVTAHVDAFLRARWHHDDVRDAIALIRQQAAADVAAGVEGAVAIPADAADSESLVLANVHWQMRLDRKTTGLKALQGLVWQEGYASGVLQGIVYDDVVTALRRWKAEGRPVYIYSSGSIAAQKLIFGHSTHGDLLPYLAGHFDTTTGPKVAASSYTAIAHAIGLAAPRILFVTDNVKEAAAARDAGWTVAVASRPGNAPLTDGDHATYPVISSFDQLPV